MRHPFLALFAAASICLCACTSEAPSDAAVESSSARADEKEKEAVVPEFDFSPGGPITEEQLADYHVWMSCAIDGEDVGTMSFALWPERAPITVRNFLRLCDEGFYDGLSFHRIMRDFMLQGGDPLGNGTGGSPHGNIEAEFSEDPERAHGYGVLSMARSTPPNSASSQFFIICDDGPSAWGLDGNYASFGRMTQGVATLEAMADVPVRSDGREKSIPTQRVTITRARARAGEPPAGEVIARPEPDLGGEPRTVLVQHVLVSFQGAPQIAATRSKGEAEILAGELLERARAGEDFAAMVREYSSDPVQEGDETPGVYRLNNLGVRNAVQERSLFELSQKAQRELQAAQSELAAGKITRDDLMARREELVAELRAAQEVVGMARSGMVPGFGDTAFSLEVGEVGMTDHHAQASPYGWHIIKRLE